jgi:PhnB protein
MNHLLNILYVKNQEKSTAFYTKTLQIEPSLNVKGMTEFTIFNNTKIGLMPEDGIASILGERVPHPNTGNGIPRCEIYLQVNNPQQYLDIATKSGAILVSKLQPRDWGETVGYVSDLDGHILAFAEKTI